MNPSSTPGFESARLLLNYISLPDDSMTKKKNKQKQKQKQKKKKKTTTTKTGKKTSSTSRPILPSPPPPPMADAPIPIPADPPLNSPPSSPSQNPHHPPPSPPPPPPPQPLSQQPEEAAELTLVPSPEGTTPIIGDRDASSLPAATPIDAAVPHLPAVPHRPPAIPRKLHAKLKKRPSVKQRASSKQKLALLTAAFRPIPFSPADALTSVDLAAHESLFRALGLWDFAHLELDQDVRPDLLVPLIANYDPANRRSFVRDLRISVSRADLARALMLPSKKDKASCADPGAFDPNQELFSREESAAAVVNFMSGFMLFQFQDDACILPTEFVTANRMVREGHLHKIDWAGLMWMLVEKELLEAPKSGVCHYASHLQCLIKYQQPRLFQEADFKLEPIPEVEIEAENSADVVMAEDEDDAEDGTEDDAAIARITSLDDLRDANEDKHGPGLSLVLGGDLAMSITDTDGFEQFKEGHDEQWLEEERNRDTEHCLRRCNSSGAGSVEFENLCKADIGGRGEDGYIDDLSAKYASLDRMSSFERLTSTDLLQVMDNVNLSYSQPINSLSSGEFLTMRTDVPKNMSTDHSRDRSFFPENNGKRKIDEIDNDEEDDEGEDTQQFVQNNQQKRMRCGTLWESPPSELDAILEQIQFYVGKARVLFAEKEQARMNTQLQLQYFDEMLQQKDRVIQSLEKTREEEQQKWHFEVCRYEHEISVMANLVIGYKKALKDTHRAFAEYRKKYPQGNEPLYKDVAGSGGLVLTIKELERKRLEKEEEVRHSIVEIISNFEKGYVLKLDGYASIVEAQYGRILKLHEKVKFLKGRYAKSLASDD